MRTKDLEEDLDTFELEYPKFGVRLIAALTRGAGRYLTPIRIYGLEGAPVPANQVRESIATQATNLKHKLHGLDRLQLTDTRFSSEFCSARLGVICEHPTTSLREVKKLVTDALFALEELTRSDHVAQLDYDLRRKHPSIGTELDTIDFATKHTPSAIATVTTFQIALEAFGGKTASPGVAVRGVGDLGSRVVQELTARSFTPVLVNDVDNTRAEAAADGDRVQSRGDAELDRAAVGAYICCADAGTLSVRRAGALMSNGSLLAVGGPEAGLDHSSEAIAKLQSAGIQFVPSVLCGSMGLVSNLLESMRAKVDLNDQRERLAITVRAIAEEALKTRRSFHAVCSDLVRGELHV
ncbi:hypothetical protein EDF24_1459 [Curtobacterium sp. PhB130]|uniref:hypothetical protein n=1 Tax=Curtobacterium sp. PhB130 TaxID=2485178 RepID=UPI000FB68D6D|nr:hypothetical protein [Curtobacterium sp. PhB130]ROS75885.1 hypothetical protein EDF24_1459 [Curtobacterium sp. PhB130]